MNMSERPPRPPLVTALQTSNIGRLGMGESGNFSMEFTHPLTILVGDNANCKTTICEAIRACLCANGDPADLGRNQSKDYLWPNCKEGTATVTFLDGTQRVWDVGKGFIDRRTDEGAEPPRIDALVAGLDAPMKITSAKELQRYWQARNAKGRPTGTDLYREVTEHAKDKLSFQHHERATATIDAMYLSLGLENDKPFEPDELVARLEGEKTASVRSFNENVTKGPGGPRSGAKMLDRYIEMSTQVQAGETVPEAHRKWQALEEQARARAGAETIEGDIAAARKAHQDKKHEVEKQRATMEVGKAGHQERLTRINGDLAAKEQTLRNNEGKVDNEKYEDADGVCPNCKQHLIYRDGKFRLWKEPKNPETTAANMERETLIVELKEQIAALKVEKQREEGKWKDSELLLAAMQGQLATLAASLDALADKHAKVADLPEVTQSEIDAAREHYEETVRKSAQTDVFEYAGRIAYTVTALEIYLHCLGPKGRLFGKSDWVGELNQVLATLNKTYGCSVLDIPAMDAKTNQFKMLGRSFKKASKGERWYAETMLQVAVAVQDKERQHVIVIDDAPMMSDMKMFGLWHLLISVVARRSNIQVIATVTDDAPYDTQSLVDKAAPEERFRDYCQIQTV